MDGVTGLSSSPANAYTSLAVAVRFNLNGTIDARNGGRFVAASTLRFVRGTTYHVILDVNVAAHTYNAYVVLGGMQMTLGTNLAFRTEQSGVAALGYVGALTVTGSHSVCNITMVNSMVAPAVITQPASVTITAGQMASFSVATSGSAPLAYQWQKNGVAISGANGSNYSTPITTLTDSGSQFTAVVSNSAGTATSVAAKLTVKAPIVAPAITSQPPAQSVTAGQPANFSVATTGTAPMMYQWSRNGAPIIGAISSSYTTALTTPSDNGTQFSVSVSNSAGTATSIPALLTVKAATPPPGCVLSAGHWFNAPLAQVQSGSFRFMFDATPATSTMDSVAGLASVPATAYTDLAAAVRFNRGGTIDARNGGAFAAATAISFVAGNTYQFILDVNIAAHTYNVYVMIGGVQTVIGSNFAFRTEQAAATSLGYLGGVAAAGNDTICNMVTTAAAATAPAITAQPSSSTVNTGQTATFSVTASGTATLTYQWQKNGVAVSGATSASYTTPATTAADNGTAFAVLVSNAAGSVSSNSASLTVSPAATLFLNSSANAVNFGNVNVSSSSMQSVTLMNAGNSSVTISQISVAGAGFNAAGSNGLTLAPGQATTVTSTFAPSASGSAAGSLTISSNASNSPAQILLTGMGVAAANHTVVLNWSAASGVVGFNTYSSTVSGGPYNKMTSAPVATPSYTDTSVQSGRTYYYVVTAVDASNQESGYSSEVLAIVP